MLDQSLTIGCQLGVELELDLSLASTEFGRILQNYILACKVEDKAKATLISYRDRVGSFLKFQQDILSRKTLKDISANDIRLYLLSLKGKNLSGSYINAHYRALRTFFNWLVVERFLSESPMENIRPPRIPSLIVKPFSRQDIDNLLSLCSGNRFLDLRNRALILIFLDTGLRNREMAGINLKDVNFDRETIRVTGKGARERVVRFGKTAQKALLKYLLSRNDNHPCLWVTEERRPLTAAGIQTTIKKLCQRAEIVDAKRGPHSFRHTFGTQALINGADIREVQSLLGHSTLKTTLTYVATVNSEQAIKTHRQWSPVDRMGLK